MTPTHLSGRRHKIRAARAVFVVGNFMNIVVLCMHMQTGLSHACGCGFMPILQLLDTLEDVDPNRADNDGNTPLIFAAQAGIQSQLNIIETL